MISEEMVEPAVNHKRTSARSPLVITAGLPASVVKLLNSSSEFTILELKGEPPEILAGCHKLGPCLLIASEQFILALDPGFLLELSGEGQLNKILAVCNSETNRVPELDLLQLGCSGVLWADMCAADMHRALHAVARGEMWFSRIVLSNAIRKLLSSSSSRRLTPREREVLQLIGQGYNNRKIAEKLFISRETVRWHVRSLYAKIGTHDRKRVTAIAAEERFAS
ncbi:MAG: response regulator transcription factor [Bryobacterales bacterium]|nr:HTH-type transcriptional regulator MalT [Anaerolineales bacterium]MCZ2078500.1 response regulator transcription factor [Bryobacterales bacterium]